MESSQNTPESTSAEGLSLADASQEPGSLPVKKRNYTKSVVVNGHRINRIGLKVCDYELGSAYQQGMFRHVYEAGKVYKTVYADLPFYFLTREECAGIKLHQLPAGISYERLLIIGYHSSDRVEKYFWFPRSLLSLSDYRRLVTDAYNFDRQYSVVKAFTAIEEISINDERYADQVIYEVVERLGLDITEPLLTDL